MNNGLEDTDQPSGEDPFMLGEGQQPSMPAFLKDRLDISPKKSGRRLFTKKHLLYSSLALLIILGVLGAGFLLIPRPIKRWSFQLESHYLFSFTPPIVSDGTVYMLLSEPGLEYNTLYAFDADSGQVKWSSYIEGFIPYSPMLANGTLYIIADDTPDRYSTLHALDAASGQDKWSIQQKSLLSSLTLSNDIVYISSGDDLFALDALSGRQIWTTHTGDDSPIVVTNTIVYLAAEDQASKESRVFALDAASGHKKWSVLEATPLIGQLTVANGLVYIATDYGAQISALDALSGNTKWSAQIEDISILESTPFVPFSLQIVNGMVYVDYQGVDTSGTGKGTNALYALDARTGQQVWTMQTANPEPAIANGRIYIYSSDGHDVSALDAQSGRVEWSHEAALFPDSSIPIEPDPIVVNGTVYVHSNALNNNTLYALDGTSGKEKWSYQTRGYFSTSLVVANGIVYTSINDNVEAIQPPGGAPGFSL